MTGVHIVTDSAADLPVEVVRERELTVVALDVRLGDLSPDSLDGATGERFWELEGETNALATTAAPSPGMFAAAYAAAREGGATGVVCVTISSELSATYQAACAGAAELGDFPVEVVDSRFATLGEGLLVLEAADAARSGADAAATAAAVRSAIARTEVFGTLENLETLRRGGRIGAAQALVGSLLSIKPVIEVRNGVVEPESRQRTRQRSLEYLAGKVREAGPLARLGVAHAAASDIDRFVTMLDDVDPAETTIVGYIGPVIGAHTGRGTIGVCLIRDA